MSFEAKILEQQKDNPRFGFLRSTDPYHAYYRWKVDLHFLFFTMRSLQTIQVFKGFFYSRTCTVVGIFRTQNKTS